PFGDQLAFGVEDFAPLPRRAIHSRHDGHEGLTQAVLAEIEGPWLTLIISGQNLGDARIFENFAATIMHVGQYQPFKRPKLPVKVPAFPLNLRAVDRGGVLLRFSVAAEQ